VHERPLEQASIFWSAGLLCGLHWAIRVFWDGKNSSLEPIHDARGPRISITVLTEGPFVIRIEVTTALKRLFFSLPVQATLTGVPADDGWTLLLIHTLMLQSSE
jgi:hypothetical protein